MPIAAAGISAGASLLGGITGGKGASQAAKIQANSYAQGLNEQHNEFAQTQANEAPFLSAGIGATEQLLRLLGLGDSNTGISVNGNPALSASEQQAGALSNLRDSPLFAGIMGSGTDAILQNAAATGGLWGGNTQDALSRLGAEAFSSTYQNSLASLMQLAGIGSGGASTLTGAGQANANSISGLLGQQGGASATGAAAPYAAATSTLGGLGKIAGNYGTQNSLSALLKSITGGGDLSLTNPSALNTQLQGTAATLGQGLAF